MLASSQIYRSYISLAIIVIYSYNIIYISNINLYNELYNIVNDNCLYSDVCS